MVVFIYLLVGLGAAMTPYARLDWALPKQFFVSILSFFLWPVFLGVLLGDIIYEYDFQDRNVE
jgi:Na+/citrate or Na+/malate symporter